jgi:hypothetical protein
LNEACPAFICDHIWLHDRLWSWCNGTPSQSAHRPGSARELLVAMAAMDLQHGCRSEYGPLELRIESSTSLSDFIVYVQDARREPRTVYQQAVQCTLESAKDYAVLRAQEYLKSWSEADGYASDWRCS